MPTTASRSRRNRKIAAIAAGALVVGLGATYTLASWTDSEWVWGGGSGEDGAGIGTEKFEVQQNTYSPNEFDDREDNPGGALNFTTEPLALTPGDSIYAPVSLRTEAGSIGGTLNLKGAVPAADGNGGIIGADHDTPLWDALTLSVYTSDAGAPFDPATACTEATFDAGAWEPLFVGQPLGTAGDPAEDKRTLAPDSGSTQHYCFVVSLPASVGSNNSDVMGEQIAPAWEFVATSTD